MEITAIIVAVISVLGQVVFLLFQRKQSKTLALKTENEASSILIDKALNINKQETENMRLLLEVIKKEYQDALIAGKQKDYDYACLEKKFKKACRLLAEKGIDASACEPGEENGNS